MALHLETIILTDSTRSYKDGIDRSSSFGGCHVWIIALFA